MNKLTLTLIAAMFSINAFASVSAASAAPASETYTKTLSCGKKVTVSRNAITKHSLAPKVIASASQKAADGNRQ